MPAIGELAAEGQLLDVQEHLGEGFRTCPQLDFSQAGRIDDQTPSRDFEQLAMAGGVAPLAAFVHIGRPQHLLPNQPINQGGFSYAG